MDVVIVAIDRRGDRNDGLERRWLECRDLKAIEAAPGDSHHADIAVGPGLRGDPFNQFDRIGKFEGRIFTVDDAIRFARPAYVDTYAGDAGFGEDRIGGLVARRGANPLAIGQELQNARHGVAGGVVRHPDARGKSGAVLEVYPLVFDDGERALGHCAGLELGMRKKGPARTGRAG